MTLALLVATVGVVALGNSGPMLAAIAVIALPIVGFILGGFVSGRGTIGACIVLALGLTLIRPVPGAIPWVELVVVSSLALLALLAGSLADRMAPTVPTATADTGRWVKVIVATEGPSDTSGRSVRPKVSPRTDPERRSLPRRASERYRERCQGRRQGHRGSRTSRT